MSAIQNIIDSLRSQPWATRCRYQVIADGESSAIAQAAGMQVTIRETGTGQMEVAYEHAIHEVTRVELAPDAAVKFILAVLQRDSLHVVPVDA